MLCGAAVDVITFSCYCFYCCCCRRHRQIHGSGTTTQLKMQHTGRQFALYLFYCFVSHSCSDLEDTTFILVGLLSVGCLPTLSNGLLELKLSLQTALISTPGSPQSDARLPYVGFTNWLSCCFMYFRSHMYKEVTYGVEDTLQTYSKALTSLRIHFLCFPENSCC